MKRMFERTILKGREKDSQYGRHAEFAEGTENDTRRIHCGLNTNYTNGTNNGLLTKLAKLEKRDGKMNANYHKWIANGWDTKLEKRDGLTKANYLKLYMDKTKPD